MNISINCKDLTKFIESLEDTEKFDVFVQAATREIAKALHEMLFETTPVRTGNLCAAWGGEKNYSYTIEKQTDGYSITLINNGANDEGFRYGLAVNDGHRTVNGGWVVGRFFVENSITLTIPKVERLVAKELKKWWKSV